MAESASQTGVAAAGAPTAETPAAVAVVPIRPGPTRAWIAGLLEVWRASLSRATREAYVGDLEDFARATGAFAARVAVEGLLSAGKLQAEQQVLSYLQDLAERRGLGPATVARRRAALRSVVRAANGLGFATWTLTAPMPRSSRPRAYRDTRGPGLGAVRRLREVAAAQGGVKGLRDVALLGILYSLGLRRAEVCSLSVGDYDQIQRTLHVVGKGHTDAELISVPEQVADELAAYLEARGSPSSGPLFAALDRAGKGDGRLTPSGVYKLLRHLARRAGLAAPVSPHRLRHSAITDALDGTKGDVRRVRSFARHGKVETTLIYDDRRRDVGGEVAVMLAAALGRPQPAEAATKEEGATDAGVPENAPSGEQDSDEK